MTQKIILPLVKKCECGNKPNVVFKWAFNHKDIEGYLVECKSCKLILTKPCNTKNRAIHRWNNRVKK